MGGHVLEVSSASHPNIATVVFGADDESYYALWKPFDLNLNLDLDSTTDDTQQYSKSSKAKCHGPAPCNGSTIELGALRYGQIEVGRFGETVEWRHWGCVTPEILRKFGQMQLTLISGYNRLRPEDQQKVRIATQRGYVDPADVPETAKRHERLSKIPLPEAEAEAAPMTAYEASRIVDAMLKRSVPWLPDDSEVPSSSQEPPVRQKRKLPWEQPQNRESILGSGSGSQASGSGSRMRMQQGGPSQGGLSVTVRAGGHASGQGIEFEDEEVEEVGAGAGDVSGIDELYCAMTTSVVGIQHYQGMVGAGEEVLLVREPTNRFDRNAIQVKNIVGVQVGHLPKQVAAKLAPLLDQKLVSVEGRIQEGNMDGNRALLHSLTMTLKIYGPSDKWNVLEPRLIWATPGQRGFPPRPAAGSSRSSSSAPTTGKPLPPSQTYDPLAVASQYAIYHAKTIEDQRRQQELMLAQQEAFKKAAELKAMLSSLEKVDDEGRRSSLLDAVCATEDVLELPVHPSPPGVGSGELKVDLLRHQSQALQWCIQHEYPTLPAQETDKPVQFWQKRMNANKPYYFNIATKTPQETPPKLGRGAICADSMGLGKTLTMLALILATKKDVPQGYSNSTLIVVPLSILSNWEGQIKEHCAQGSLSYYLYYDKARSISHKELQAYDVVITTYQTVSKEHTEEDSSADITPGQNGVKKRKKGGKGLFGVEWKRIILDEGHTIRNPKIKLTRAVCALSAERRWVVTGTPIINSPRDLGSLLTFLRICSPLDDDNFFKRLLLRPLKDGDPQGAELLKALMSQICIRRTKEMQDNKGKHLVPLPPVEITMIPVQLDEEARALYDTVEEISKQRVARYMHSHGGATVPTNVLAMLTRLRQIALHPGLIPSSYLEDLQSSEAEEDGATPERPAIEITPERKLHLQTQLARYIEDNEECPICFIIPTAPRITACSHFLCIECITEILSRDARCPLDRRHFTINDVIEPLPPTESTQAVRREVDEEAQDSDRKGSSAKINQLVHLLKLTPSHEKSLVFSQFTSFLDKIAEQLDIEGISYVRFDGSMSVRKRQEALDRFCVPLKDPASSLHDDGDDDDQDDDIVFLSQSKGKGKAKTEMTAYDKILSSFRNPQVMLISLKAGALGLNLTVANNVYLMDPWWQEGIESQAIDRCNRIGQKRPVHVYQMIAENTVESKVIEIQEKKKKLVQQAFAGIKTTETPRQKREARLQDLIELFGVRNNASSRVRA